MANGAVLLTGATGFLGKVVLEDLLRRRGELGVETVFVLIRAPGAETARRRLDSEVLGSRCLARLDDAARDCVVPVAGDLLEPDCRLEPEARRTLTERVTEVIHCAASIDFDLPVAEAAAINVGGALHVLELARACDSLRSMVSVSTAYVTPHPGDARPVPEALAPLPRPAEALLAEIEAGPVDEAALLRESGHPNTYTYTKAIAEHLLQARRGDVPLSLVRPSIISASRRRPFPGWIDSHAAFAGFVSLLATGALRVVAARLETRVDVVPCDDVAERVVDVVFAAPAADMRIHHAVAGPEGCSSVALCRESIERFFASRRIGPGPRIRHVGPDGPLLRARAWLQQRVPLAITAALLRLRRREGPARTLAKLSERQRYLNSVFRYFTHNTFAFASSLPLDDDFEPRAYLETVCRGVYTHLLRGDEGEFVFAGRQRRVKSDLAWTIGQPRGRPAVRVAGWMLAKILRRITPRATVDLVSFEHALARVRPGAHLVIAPTHRSYLDFLLLPYLCFACPELELDMPHIAADEQFARIPVLSRLARRCNAFFLRRGQGGEDKGLTRQVDGLVRGGATILFFIEGGRSRARTLLPPRRGLLRSLQATGEDFAILPVTISYDRVPEEGVFAAELAGGPRQRIELGALAGWLRRVWRGEVDIGPVHLRCADPLPLDLASDVGEVATRIVRELAQGAVATTHQLRCFLARRPIDGADVGWLQEAIRRRGGRVITSRLRGESEVPPLVEVGMREQWQHVFLPELRERFGGDPALRHFLGRAGDILDGGVREPDDTRTGALLEALIDPVRRAYAAVALELARGGPGAPSTPVELLRRRPDLYLPHLEAAFEYATERVLA